MATSSAIINASKDNDLRERLIALAAEAKIQNPQLFVESHLQQLAASEVNDNGDTIASVYEYTESVYHKELAKLVAPGKNLGGVTDNYLRYALENVLRSEGSNTAAATATEPVATDANL